MATAARSAELERRLAQVVGSEHVRSDAGARYAYATDATPMHSGMPSCIVLPGSTDDLAAVLRNGTVVLHAGRGTVADDGADAA